LKQRLQRSVAALHGEAVLRRDLTRIGSSVLVSRALNQLVAQANLVCIDSGLYARAASAPISGHPMERQPLGALAADTLD
jgi:hypothetical protein